MRYSAKSAWDLATEAKNEILAHSTGLPIFLYEVGAGEDIAKGRRAQLYESSLLLERSWFLIGFMSCVACVSSVCIQKNT